MTKKRKFPWLILGGTPLGILTLAGVGFVVWAVQPPVQDEIFTFFLVLMLALLFTHERLMFRVNTLGEGLHMHLDQAGMSVESPTMGVDQRQPRLLKEIGEIRETLDALKETLEDRI